MNKSYKKEDNVKREVVPQKAKGVYSPNRGSGLYVYDVARLLEASHVEIYKLGRAVVGVNNVIAFHGHSKTIAFLESFAKLQMQSLPHRNNINFLGMRKKSDYLIWREKNGFFTAMDKQG